VRLLEGIHVLHTILKRGVGALALTLVPLAGGVFTAPPSMASNPVVGSASIGVPDYGAYIGVCPHGDASFLPVVNGQWRLQWAGTRSNASVIQGSGAASGVSTWNPSCFQVYKNGAANGAFNATLDYVGAGGDVLAHAEAAAGWGTGTSLLGIVNFGT